MCGEVSGENLNHRGADPARRLLRVFLRNGLYFVDAYFPKDARASAQGLFNVMILGVGALLANSLCPLSGPEGIHARRCDGLPPPVPGSDDLRPGGRGGAGVVFSSAEDGRAGRRRALISFRRPAPARNDFLDRRPVRRIGDARLVPRGCQPADDQGVGLLLRKIAERLGRL